MSPIPRPRVLKFDAHASSQGAVGTVHRDGSITFRGKTYRTIKELPETCSTLRPDVDSLVQWRKLYRAIDPKRKC